MTSITNHSPATPIADAILRLFVKPTTSNASAQDGGAPEATAAEVQTKTAAPQAQDAADNLYLRLLR